MLNVQLSKLKIFLQVFKSLDLIYQHIFKAIDQFFDVLISTGHRGLQGALAHRSRAYQGSQRTEKQFYLILKLLILCVAHAALKALRNDAHAGIVE